MDSTIPTETGKTPQSRIGKRPVAVPKGVTTAIKDGTIRVEGPKGKLGLALPAGIDVAIDSGMVKVTSQLSGRDAPRMQGLIRALIASMVKGAAEGYGKTLELRGTGYRAELKGTTLNLSLGFSHPVIFPLPPGVKCEIPGDSKGTIMNLSSADKDLLGQTAAKIRSFRPPEPYAGKGVRYQGEKVREKAGKAGKGGKGAK
jgi:large subunit ribosomal protein L6